MPRAKLSRRLAAAVWLLAGALLCSSGCGARRPEPSAEGDEADALAAVSMVLSDLDVARQERDLGRLLERFDPKVLVLPPGDELLEGSAMVREWLETHPGHLCPLRAPANATGEAAGDWAYLTWSEDSPRAGVAPAALRVLVVLHRGPGGWMVKRLVWNHGPALAEEARG